MNTVALVEAIRNKRKFYCIKYFDFLEQIDLSEGTFKRRMQNPGTFTLDEAERIMKVLCFTKEERTAIFCENS